MVQQRAPIASTPARSLPHVAEDRCKMERKWGDARQPMRLCSCSRAAAWHSRRSLRSCVPRWTTICVAVFDGGGLPRPHLLERHGVKFVSALFLCHGPIPSRVCDGYLSRNVHSSSPLFFRWVRRASQYGPDHHVQKALVDFQLHNWCRGIGVTVHLADASVSCSCLACGA